MSAEKTVESEALGRVPNPPKYAFRPPSNTQNLKKSGDGFWKGHIAHLYKLLKPNPNP